MCSRSKFLHARNYIRKLHIVNEVSTSPVYLSILHSSPLINFSRTHYRRQKKWWSAYLLFYDRQDQEKVFNGKEKEVLFMIAGFWPKYLRRGL